MATYKTSTNTDPLKSTFGEQSSGVSALQTYLNSKGAGLSVDSKYGPLTQAAVAKYGLPTAPKVDTAVAAKVLTYTNGIITRDYAGAGGAVNTAHGLGAIPKKVKFTAVFAASTSNDTAAMSWGVYNGTTTSTVYVENDTNGSLVKYGNDTTNAVVIIDGLSGGVSQKAVCTFDATNITLTWTKSGSGSGAIYIMWEAER